MSGDFFFGVFLFLLLRWLALLFNLLAFPRLRPRPTPPKPTASSSCRPGTRRRT